mgnify:CR=1 FL=1
MAVEETGKDVEVVDAAAIVHEEPPIVVDIADPSVGVKLMKSLDGSNVK